MKKLFFMAVAAMAALSGCTSDDELANGSKKGAYEFTATIEGNGDVRTTLGEKDVNDKYPVNWSEGDEINAGGQVFTTSTAGGTATFTGETAPAKDGGVYKAYYPAGMYSAGTVTLPASYTYEEGRFNMPMYAESETNQLAFKNLCGVLAITVPSTTATTVSYIEVKTDNQLNGAFTVDASNDYKVNFTAANLTKALQTVKLNCNKVTIADSRTFYIPLPAVFCECMIVGVNDGSSTKYMTINVDVTIERNKIYPVQFTENSSTAVRGLEIATISSVTRYVAWKQMYSGDGRSKYATINVGMAIPNYASVTSTDDAVRYHTYYIGKPYSWGSITYKDMGEYNETTSKLPKDNDTAYKYWGSKWRMSSSDIVSSETLNNALHANCVMTVIDGTTTQYVPGCTLSGLKFTGKGAYSNNSIFLPAAGMMNKPDIFRDGMSPGQYVCYWSVSPKTKTTVRVLLYSMSERCFKDFADDGTSTCSKKYACSNRAVLYW